MMVFRSTGTSSILLLQLKTSQPLWPAWVSHWTSGAPNSPSSLKDRTFNPTSFSACGTRVPTSSSQTIVFLADGAKLGKGDYPGKEDEAVGGRVCQEGIVSTSDWRTVPTWSTCGGGGRMLGGGGGV